MSAFLRYLLYFENPISSKQDFEVAWGKLQKMLCLIGKTYPEVVSQWNAIANDVLKLMWKITPFVATAAFVAIITTVATFYDTRYQPCCVIFNSLMMRILPELYGLMMSWHQLASHWKIKLTSPRAIHTKVSMV